jgi:hypothetical protein
MPSRKNISNGWYPLNFPVEVILSIVDNKPCEKPMLHLLTMDLISEHNAGIMRMDLKAI